MKFLTYLRYVLCFKLWKKLIHSSGIAATIKRKELENLRSLLRGLNVPYDFMTHHQKYNWSNWPKLTMSPNGTPDSIERDLKNVSFVLYGATLQLKECYKVNLVLKCYKLLNIVSNIKSLKLNLTHPPIYSSF